MNRFTSLAASPGQAYFTLSEHLREAQRENIRAWSPDSKVFKEFYTQTEGVLRELLQVPESFRMLFFRDISDAEVHILQNFASEGSFHFVNGRASASFSEKADLLGISTEKEIISPQKGFSFDDFNIPEGKQLITLCKTEPETGAETPNRETAKIREIYPEKTLALNMDYALPYAEPDYERADLFYFSVTNGFGVPSPLTVLLIREGVLERSRASLSAEHYMSLIRKAGYAKRKQVTFRTNLLPFFLLNRICEDFIEKGLDRIRTETRRKAARTYFALQESTTLRPAVEEKDFRSKVIIGIESLNGKASVLGTDFYERGFIVGAAQGDLAARFFYLANFPTLSEERLDQVIEMITVN